MKCMSGKSIADPWGEIKSVRPVKRVVGMLADGISEAEIRHHLMTEFHVSEEKTALALAVASYERQLVGKLDSHDAGLYIDIPFCPTRCAYCSFASMSADRMKDYAEPYLAALYRELDAVGRIVKDLNFTIKTVYIGGGTPTTLMALELDNLLYKIHSVFDLSHVTEFSVEAGRPDTITPEKLAVMCQRGVTRISVNPQTIHEKTLERIGRKHSAAAVFEAVDMVRAHHFPVLNMDVIAGLPGENIDDFRATLEAVTACRPENLTLHTMSIKRASQLKQSDFEPTDMQHSAAANMLAFAHPFLQQNGYKGYYLYRQKNTLGNLENTGFCLRNTASLYNMGMMEDFLPVFGVGVGAVTKLVRTGRIERIFNVKDVAEYIARQAEMRERKQYAYTFYEGNFGEAKAKD